MAAGTWRAGEGRCRRLKTGNCGCCRQMTRRWETAPTCKGGGGNGLDAVQWTAWDPAAEALDLLPRSREAEVGAERSWRSWCSEAANGLI